MPVVTVTEGTPTTINDAALAKRLNAVMAATSGRIMSRRSSRRGWARRTSPDLVQPDSGVRGYYLSVGGTPAAALAAAKAGGPRSPRTTRPSSGSRPSPRS
jgi:hippurate hydrolase